MSACDVHEEVRPLNLVHNRPLTRSVSQCPSHRAELVCSTAQTCVLWRVDTD